MWNVTNCISHQYWLMSNRSGWAILCKTITINWPPSTHKCLWVLMLLACVLRYYIGLSFKVIIHYIFIRLLTSLHSFKLFSFLLLYIYITVFIYQVGASILKRLTVKKKRNRWWLRNPAITDSISLFLQTPTRMVNCSSIKVLQDCE